MAQDFSKRNRGPKSAPHAFFPLRERCTARAQMADHPMEARIS
jgi:hypothetical protein